MSKIYIVKSGDTLWGISKKHHISVKELARINSLSGRMIHNLRICLLYTSPSPRDILMDLVCR
ncbi:LysM peptidoglycan-binding domain-containing protein, partial [Acinetobacter baumannii]|uniref:LysM peptidoglycan-binding domain-containing protein n=1 Tax=Acinetobacter baumannii TaxID=470 RepID=UPI003AFA5577